MAYEYQRTQSTRAGARRTIVVNHEGLARGERGEVTGGGGSSGTPLDLRALECRLSTGTSVGRGESGGLPAGSQNRVGVVEEAQGGVASVDEGGLDRKVVRTRDSAGTCNLASQLAE